MSLCVWGGAFGAGGDGRRKEIRKGETSWVTIASAAGAFYHLSVHYIAAATVFIDNNDNKAQYNNTESVSLWQNDDVDYVSLYHRVIECALWAANKPERKKDDIRSSLEE